MLYHLHEFQKAAAFPAHEWASATRLFLETFHIQNHPIGNYVTASNEMLERATRCFEKPSFRLSDFINHHGGTDQKIHIQETIIRSSPFCNLLYFQRTNDIGQEFGRHHPKVLIVAPLSGHYATLLRDTVRTFIPHHQVYITDWKNARDIPMSDGSFTLDDYVDFLIDIIMLFHGNIHIVAVCQPVVPVLMAVSHMAAIQSAYQAKSMILMGGPIDTRINPGKVNTFAKEHTLEWFENNIIDHVPLYYPGAGRRVCPGFIMLDGFMALNIERHQEASFQLFQHLVQGDMETVENHKVFYDEYRSVMDVPSEYYLDSIKKIFLKHELPRGKMKYKDHVIKPELIQKTALLTIEGGRDDISCLGQTYAAQDLCKGLKDEQKDHFVQHDVGHYGIFNGRRFRDFIYPKMASFIKKW